MPKQKSWENGSMSLREAECLYSVEEMLKDSLKKVHKLPKRKIGRWTDHMSTRYLQTMEIKPHLAAPQHTNDGSRLIRMLSEDTRRLVELSPIRRRKLN
jgi:hypothetical protein